MSEEQPMVFLRQETTLEELGDEAPEQEYDTWLAKIGEVMKR